MRIRFSIAILIFFSSNVLLSQVTGEWVLSDYPESDIVDVVTKDEMCVLLLRSIHEFADTNTYDYETHVLEFMHEEHNEIVFNNLYNKNSGSRRTVSSRLSYLNNNWLYAESTFGDLIQDSFFLKVFDEDFAMIENTSYPLYSYLFHYCSAVHGNGEYTGIGSILIPTDSLLRVNYSTVSQTSQIDVFRTIPQPTISFISSIEYDSIRKRFLVFHYRGIAHLDDTLGLIQKYPESVVQTSQHGNVLSKDLHYYSFGATAFQGSPEFRDLVFQQYDTSMQIMFADTFGRPGKDDYPFINQSLDESDGNFYVGGMLAGPFNFNNRDTLKFFLAKYNQDLDRLWYREYGGSHSYVIRGLTGMPDGRCLVYGYRVDNNDGIRYPYLLIVNEDGQITSSKDVPKSESELFQILYTAESENIAINANREIDELQLFSLDGKSIARYQKILPGIHDLNLAYLPPGVYVFLATSGKERQSGKWVKR